MSKAFKVRVGSMTTGTTQAAHEGAAASAVLRSLPRIQVGESVTVTITRVS